MIYYVVDCWYENGYVNAIFHGVYKRLAYARKAFEKYKPRALGSDNIKLLMYQVDTSETDESGFYKQEWIEEI